MDVDQKQKWIVIDTEGSGLFNYKLPADDPSQPHMASVAMIFCNDDLVAEKTYSTLVKPTDWVLSEEAAKVNGLTMERLHAEGVDVRLPLQVYTDAINDGYAVMAYNAQHDMKTMRSELRRLGLPDLFEQTRNTCVMRKSMGYVVKQGGKKGWPKLSDATNHFNIQQRDHHTPIGDAIACLEVARRLKGLGVDLTPEVHFAKEAPVGKQASMDF